MALIAKYSACKWELADGYTDYMQGSPSAAGQEVRAIADSGYGSSPGNAMEMLNSMNTDSPAMGRMRVPIMRVTNGFKNSDHSAPNTAGFQCKKTIPLLSAENLSFLRSLPTRRSVVLDGTRLELLHAAPADPLFQYLPASRVEEWRSAASGIEAELILVGHTHLPVVVLDLGGKRMVNPGSVGLPRDGDPGA